MISKSKLALIAAVVALGIASPAFAQSFDPDAGSGNVLAFGYAPSATQEGATAIRHGQIAVDRSGLHAFAKVPGGASGQPIERTVPSGLPNQRG